MSSEVLTKEVSNQSTSSRSKGRRNKDTQAQLDARRRLEDKLEDKKLEKELLEFDFDYA